MKRVSALVFFMLCLLIYGSKAQEVAIKSNFLYDVTTTMNIGVEIGLADQWTLDIPVNYNPWKLNNGARLRHLGLQPEVRYWFSERFSRTFVGAHAHYAKFNVGNLPDWSFISDNMQQNRYQGDLYGVGISIGHSWAIHEKWSIEASLGLGYARIVYDKYPCGECGTKIKEDSKNYFGPTKAALSVVYFIR